MIVRTAAGGWALASGWGDGAEEATIAGIQQEGMGTWRRMIGGARRKRWVLETSEAEWAWYSLNRTLDQWQTEVIGLILGLKNESKMAQDLKTRITAVSSEGTDFLIWFRNISTVWDMDWEGIVAIFSKISNRKLSIWLDLGWKTRTDDTHVESQRFYFNGQIQQAMKVGCICMHLFWVSEGKGYI